MDDERQIILQMLAHGKIDAKKAAELIEALDERTARAASDSIPTKDGASSPASDRAPDRPSDPVRTPAVFEDMGRELADHIEEIVSRSVNKGTEIASRVADSAVKGALAFGERLSAKRIDQKIRRKTERALARMARVGHGSDRYRPEAPASRLEQDSGLADWRVGLHGTYEIACSTDSEEASEMLEEMLDLANDIASKLADTARYAIRASQAENLSIAIESLDDIIEHLSDAQKHARQMESHLSGLMGLAGMVKAPGFKEGLSVLGSSWKPVLAKLDGVLARTMAARSEVLASVRSAVAEIGLAGV